MTASRVVNNTGNVNEDAQQRVLDAVRALGYIRNSAASALRAQGAPTWTIGLLLDDVGNPFSAALHRAVEDMARANGSLVLTASTDESHAQMSKLVDEFLSRRVDGLVVAPPPGDQRYLEAAIRRGLPIVLIDRPAVDAPLPTVMSDGRGGMLRAAQHLASFGHRRIAYVGDTRSPAMRLRFDGFVEGLHASGLTPCPQLMRTDVESVEESRDAVVAMLALEDPPTAIIAARNQVTIGAVRALHAAGQQHRVALVGFDDLDLAADLDPALTVIAQDPRGIGTTAAAMLFEQLSGGAAATCGVQMEPELIPRGSGEIRAARR